MTSSFQGRTALVTGAGRGIGQAIALDLARRGAIVILVARNHEQLETTADMIRTAGGAALVFAGDLASMDDVDRIMDAVGDHPTPVDILINNAGDVAPLGPTATLDINAYERAIALNLLAPVALTARALLAMLGHGWGRIVNISSGVAGNPASMVGANAYTTSKAALEAHTLNLAAELEDSGVTVNAYRPGIVDTAMQTWIRDQEASAIGQQLSDRFHRFHERGLLITPEASAAHLCSHLQETETGHIWDISNFS
jgi:NAD(P)-dependent dehydrogenase (short-subunit alcohol dehydrogenase family)